MTTLRIAEMIVNRLRRRGDQLLGLEPGGDDARHARDQPHSFGAPLLAAVAQSVLDRDRGMPREHAQRLQIALAELAAAAARR